MGYFTIGLTISKRTFDTDEMTKFLGVPPTLLVTPTPQGPFTTQWMISSSDVFEESDSMNNSQEINWFVNRVFPIKDKLKQLEEDNFRVQITLGLVMCKKLDFMILYPCVLEQLATLDLPIFCQFDFIGKQDMV